MRPATCPLCDSHDAVEPSGQDERPWWCRTCNLVFDGSTPEYLRMYRRREDHKEAAAAGAPPQPLPIAPASYHPTREDIE